MSFNPSDPPPNGRTYAVPVSHNWQKIHPFNFSAGLGPSNPFTAASNPFLPVTPIEPAQDPAVFGTRLRLLALEKENEQLIKHAKNREEFEQRLKNMEDLAKRLETAEEKIESLNKLIKDYNTKLRKAITDGENSEKYAKQLEIENKKLDLSLKASKARIGELKTPTDTQKLGLQFEHANTSTTGTEVETGKAKLSKQNKVLRATVDSLNEEIKGLLMGTDKLTEEVRELRTAQNPALSYSAIQAIETIPESPVIPPKSSLTLSFVQTLAQTKPVTAPQPKLTFSSVETIFETIPKSPTKATFYAEAATQTNAPVTQVPSTVAFGAQTEAPVTPVLSTADFGTQTKAPVTLVPSTADFGTQTYAPLTPVPSTVNFKAQTAAPFTVDFAIQTDVAFPSIAMQTDSLLDPVSSNVGTQTVAPPSLPVTHSIGIQTDAPSTSTACAATQTNLFPLPIIYVKDPNAWTLRQIIYLFLALILLLPCMLWIRTFTSDYGAFGYGGSSADDWVTRYVNPRVYRALLKPNPKFLLH
jgi:hypothetical protein